MPGPDAHTTRVLRRFALPLIALLATLLVAAPVRADDGRDGDAYLAELRDRVAALRDRLPQITAAGQALANHHATDVSPAGPSFAILDNPALAHELGQRAGSMFNYDARATPRPDDAVITTTPDTLTVTLPDGNAYDIDITAAAPGRHGPARFASRSPSLTAPLHAAAAHAMLVEAFAAATRLGHVPVVRESFDTDTRRDRFYRTLGQRFHRDRWLDPIPPEALAKQYLDRLDTHLLDLQTAARPALMRAADRVAAARRAGHRVYLVAGPHGLPHHLAELRGADKKGSDPFFVALTDGHAVTTRDVVLAFADYQHAGDYDYFPQVDQVRQTRRVVWLLNAHNTYPHDLRRGELVVDLYTPVGDAAVYVDHYDAPLGPTSGVVTLAAYHFLAQESLRSGSVLTRHAGDRQ